MTPAHSCGAATRESRSAGHYRARNPGTANALNCPFESSVQHKSDRPRAPECRLGSAAFTGSCSSHRGRSA
jgi:hypothetical protein